MHHLFDDLTHSWIDIQRRVWKSSWPVTWPPRFPGANAAALPALKPWYPPTPRQALALQNSVIDTAADRLRSQLLSPWPYLAAVSWSQRSVENWLDMCGTYWTAWSKMLTAVTPTAAQRVPPRRTESAPVTTASSAPAAKSKRPRTAPAQARKTASAPSTRRKLNAKDDLKRIVGIGPGLEKKLNQSGIYTYRQIAELTYAEIKRLEQGIIRFPGRIQRDNWVGQAKALCKQG